MGDGCHVCGGPVGDYGPWLCTPHWAEWQKSGERRRVGAGGLVRIALPDFVRRIQAEERNARHGS
jgi:hypothetical protein